MEPSESRKNDDFGKSSKLTGISAGNFRDRRFPGIPGGLYSGPETRLYFHAGKASGGS